MQLQAYLTENGLSLTAFARRIDVRISTLHRYARGYRFPPPEMLLRIREATDGRVTADDFVDQHTAHLQAQPEAA